QLSGILWIYKKWLASEYLPLDIFMPYNQINKYFENYRIGPFILSIAMYDQLKMADKNVQLDILDSWISTNISAEILKYPQFMRALTIAIIIECLCKSFLLRLY
ncbi:uncharacterized protein LOC103311744, partial [Acyrthosiphon pisum]|uniref:Uncharacterized protein n=1 Tax=Acyrthosiphon pisum TaxID=7029 RepID=A0A8R2NX50_ACYPI